MQHKIQNIILVNNAFHTVASRHVVALYKTAFSEEMQIMCHLTFLKIWL